MNKYMFNEIEVLKTIQEHWTAFMKNVNADKCVIGISGGIDSTCVAALACKTFGKENVIGVSLPCMEQKDIEDVNAAFEHLQIKRLDFNIGEAFKSIILGLKNYDIDVSDVTQTNLPARLRMATLYAFSQSIPKSIVINTCNLSEDLLGWNTFGGDNIGSYAPIRWLTKTEVRKIASAIGVPDALVKKIPIDGLQPLSDEEKFGFSYADFDDYVRTGNPAFKYADKARSMYLKNKFKLDIIDLPGPKLDFPNCIASKEA